VGAHLSLGYDFSRIGPLVPVSELNVLSDEHANSPRVIHVDHFGNAVTNISVKDNKQLKGIFLAGEREVFIETADYYSQVVPGKTAVIPGSTGFWEIATNLGRAAKDFNIQVNTAIQPVYKENPSF